MHVQLAEHDRASRFEPADDFRILGRHAIGEDRAAGGGAHAGRVEEVLERDRDAVQAAPSPPARHRRLLRLSHPRAPGRAMTVMKAFKGGFRRSMRARQAWVSSTGDTFRASRRSLASLSDSAVRSSGRLETCAA